MREIKFRAWDGEKMLTDIAIIEGKAVPRGYVATWWANTLENAMQYTGLKDKNGKEIYEGDILTKVKNSSLDLYVSWCQDECYYDLRSLSGVPFKKLTKNNVIKSEVIGNIYENAELLEEAK